MKISFIRHGQTDYNKEGRTQGQEIDAEMNEAGLRQVEAVSATLADGIDLIIASPLKRALQTAEIIAGRFGTPIVLRDDVMELRCGSLAGKTWPEIILETGDPDVHHKDITAAYDYRPYGGESADEVKERVLGFIEYARSEHPEKKLLVATHGGIIEAMQALFSHAAVHEAENAALYEFEV